MYKYVIKTCALMAAQRKKTKGAKLTEKEQGVAYIQAKLIDTLRLVQQLVNDTGFNSYRTGDDRSLYEADIQNGRTVLTYMKEGKQTVLELYGDEALERMDKLNEQEKDEIKRTRDEYFEWLEKQKHQVSKRMASLARLNAEYLRDDSPGARRNFRNEYTAKYIKYKQGEGPEPAKRPYTKRLPAHASGMPADASGMPAHAGGMQLKLHFI